ncbi:MAG: Gfo/Idh/MocA family oxidoreductase [Opitutaceae bacterium]|nr:Gfo/Idh/MocA family oxidoreductase [Opitutaceae bacterium]
MSKPSHHILVIGCGSIGERHVRTFLATGRCTVLACDNRPMIRERMTAQYGVEAVADWREALRRPDLTGAVIATPAPLHVEQARATLESGRHVLIEKPLALAVAGADALPAVRDRSGRYAAIGYTLHSVPALRAAREFIRAGSFGAVKHAAINTGQHFPLFRPAYREIYYRDHAQGGGAIQDALTHMANMVEWILGPTTRLTCDAGHQVLEGVEVEDTVTVLARNGGAIVSYSLNQFQAPNETRLDFHAETGSVRVEMHAQRWGTLARGDADWRWTPAPVEHRDNLYITQAADFLDGCEGRPTPLCTLEEGIQTLRFNVAALDSWRNSRTVVP